jgi:hypothetical protein
MVQGANATAGKRRGCQAPTRGFGYACRNPAGRSRVNGYLFIIE